MSRRHHPDAATMRFGIEVLTSRWHRKMDLSWKRVGFIGFVL